MDTHATMMTGPVATMPGGVVERRLEERETAIAQLWMIDQQDATVLRCRCMDRSAAGMRLRIPLGYGVHPGQRYELCSHPPGALRTPGLGLMVRRRATVRWSKIVLDGGEDHIDVGVALDPDETVFTGPVVLPDA